MYFAFSTNQLHRAFFARADYSGVYNLLPDAAQRGRKRPGYRFARFQAMYQILDRVLIGRLQLIYRNLTRLWLIFCLRANDRLEIVTADRARASDDHEAAFRLRLTHPRVSERAPTRFVFRQAAFITSDRHAVFVNFQSRRLINDGGDFNRRAPVVKPRAERHAVTEIIEQRSASARLFVPPTVRLLALDLFIADFDFISQVIERSAIAVVVMNLDYVADHAFINQTLRRAVRRVPGERPIDNQRFASGVHRANHRVGVSERRRHRFFYQNVDSERGDFFDAIRVARRGGAENRDVGFRSL